MYNFFILVPKYIYNELETFLYHWKDRPYFLLFWIVVRYSTRTRYSLEIELEDDFVFKDSMNFKYQINSPHIEIPYPKVGAFLESKKITVPTELFLSMKDYSKNEDKEVIATDVDVNTVMAVGITAENRYTYSLPGQAEPTPCTDAELRKQLAIFIPQLGDKHIIEIQASRTASYDRYFHLQNILTRVYRDDLKLKYKQRISETYVP